MRDPPPDREIEDGEPIGDALVRVGRLLYVCDHLPGGDLHVVHLTFEATRIADTVGAVAEGADSTPIRGVHLVDLADLPSLGLSPRFAALAQAGWPGAGSYMGAKANIGL
ncbi:NUDIX hydrolase [Nonomuraea wenchangensis]